MKMHSIIMTAVLASGSLAVAAHADLLAYWNFNDLDIPAGTTNVPGDGNVPLSISADAGTGDLSLADWGGSVQDFGGSTLNALFGDASGASLSLQHGSGGLDGNGTSIEFSLSMSGYEGLQLSWAGRGTGTGFSSNQVSYSTDGVTFTDFGSPYDSTQSDFELYEFDFDSLLDDANNVTIRITFNGATTAAGNNRLDNVQFNATPISTAPVAVSLNADEDCYDEGVGDTVSVSIDLSGDNATEIVGGQFFMEYDPTVLQFVSADPGDPPFSLEIYEFHVAGLIDYAVGVGHGESGTTGDATLAVLTFTTLQEGCDVSSLVQFRPNSPPTRLADGFGGEVLPDLADLGQITIDGTAPVLSIPSDWTAECDEATDPANTGGFATATDNCDSEPVITFSDVTDLSGCGGYTGTITRTWTATDACGNTSSDDQIIEIVDTTPPALVDVPGDITVYSDAGFCSAIVSITPPTATDNCDSAPVVTYERSDDSSLSLGDPFPTGTTTITWLAEDVCGNSSVGSTEVTVEPYTELLLEIALDGNFSGTSFTRCITLEFTPTGGGAPVVSEHTIGFSSGSQSIGILVPCGDYECVNARDPLHTLRAVGDLSLLDPTTYRAGFGVIDGSPLVSGDLNDDGVIDILDFGIFVWQYGVNYGFVDTDCTTPFPHADLTGDGTVGAGDFSFIQINFLEVDETCGTALLAGRNPTMRSAAGTGPLTQVSVRELHQMGLGHLAVADLNGDGVVDAQDIALFLTNQ